MYENTKHLSRRRAEKKDEKKSGGADHHHRPAIADARSSTPS
jgi:hypothetical protein